jgi:hypothetical protein
VAWRRRQEPPRIEPPEWYRTYHPEDWDEPDGQEQAMMDGSGAPAAMWPPELREIHARRRWGEAQHRYRQQHPAFASQEFDDLITSHRERHT